MSTFGSDESRGIRSIDQNLRTSVTCDPGRVVREHLRADLGYRSGSRRCRRVGQCLGLRHWCSELQQLDGEKADAKNSEPIGVYIERFET